MSVPRCGPWVSVIPTLHPPHTLQAWFNSPGSIKKLGEIQILGEKPIWYVEFARGAKHIMPWRKIGSK